MKLQPLVRFSHAADGFRLALTELVPSTGPLPAGAPTFMLVHGFAQNRLAYTLGAVPLALAARGGRVLVGELRGHGLSEHPTDRIDHEATLAHHLRQDLPALLDRACQIGGVSSVHLMGHSMGGMLGYALLARSSALLSLTTFGSPVVLGSGRPLLRLAAHVARPVVRTLRPRRVPMHHLLRWVGPKASRPVRSGPLGVVRNAIRLANPHVASPDAIDAILANAHPVSHGVMRDMARLAAGGHAQIDGTDLAEAVAASRLPVAAVIGGRDVFAGRESVRPIERGSGPRKIIVLEEAAHVDLTMGASSHGVVDELWPFLIGAA